MYFRKAPFGYAIYCSQPKQNNSGGRSDHLFVKRKRSLMNTVRDDEKNRKSHQKKSKDNKTITRQEKIRGSERNDVQPIEASARHSRSISALRNNPPAPRNIYIYIK